MALRHRLSVARGLALRATVLSCATLAASVPTALAADQAPTVALKVTGSRAPYFVLPSRPGQVRHGSVTVLNVGRAGGGVSLYPTDATTGATSGAVYLSAAQAHHGVGTWLHLSRQHLVLAPGQRVRVPFTLTIPAGSGAGTHLGGIVAAPDEPQAVVRHTRGKAAFGVQIREQSVIAVQVNLPGPRIEHLAVTSIGTGSEADYQTVLVGLRSTGDVLTRASGRLTVTDDHGHVLDDHSFKLDTFVPDTSIQYPMAVPGHALRPGHYVARVTLDWGQGSVTRELALEVRPPNGTQTFGSRAAGIIPPVVARASRGSGLPWIIGGGLAAFTALALGFMVGNRTRRRPAET